MRGKLEFPSIIHPFNKYLLNFYFMPGTVLTGDSTLHKAQLLHLRCFQLWGGGSGVIGGGGGGLGTEDTGSVRTI